MKRIEIDGEAGLDAYAAQAYLTQAARDLKSEAAAAARHLRGRTVWMVNSTARGGGVAEMLPKMVRILRDLDIRTEWAVMETERTEFFGLTKRIHNLIHGEGAPRLGGEDRALYDAVSRETADRLRPLLGKDDILAIHDPQPLGAGALLKRELGLPAVWRCHIGLDEETPATRAAWEFLRPYATAYDHAVFSAPEYIPSYLARRASIIHPAIDPLSPKNSDLSIVEMFGILCNSGLMRETHPVVRPDWSHPARRLKPDGAFAPAGEAEEIGLGFRPSVLQVSRWDRLKGWSPLLKGFALLKARAAKESDARHRRRLEIVRLVLAGPDPSSIQDDPEGVAVLEELKAEYRGLPSAVQSDVALLALPMASRRENALIVNVLQRASTLVVQNSLQEGFGLTATEAMWKRTPILATRACGLRIQVRDGLEGRINEEPENPEAVCALLDEMLRTEDARRTWGGAAQRRVYDEFLVFSQLRRWLAVLTGLIEKQTRRRKPK